MSVLISMLFSFVIGLMLFGIIPYLIGYLVDYYLTKINSKKDQ